mmetsp:Transcript_5440/g.7071  ORF Transcript_5440/g.7071 Transcript_5440/m.7071 type:complete len:189 (-) Transcript_5440:568-1134(-)
MIIIFGSGISASWGIAIFLLSIASQCFSIESLQASITLISCLVCVGFCTVWIMNHFNEFQNVNTEQTHQNPSQTNAITKKISTMPLETFCTIEDLSSLSVGDLKERMKNRSLQITNCVEKSDFVDMLSSHHSFKQTSCVICFDDFDSSSVIRVLPACQHCFHIECIDRWAFSSSSTSSPSCPLCKTDL